MSQKNKPRDRAVGRETKTCRNCWSLQSGLNPGRPLVWINPYILLFPRLPQVEFTMFVISSVSTPPQFVLVQLPMKEKGRSVLCDLGQIKFLKLNCLACEMGWLLLHPAVCMTQVGIWFLRSQIFLPHQSQLCQCSKVPVHGPYPSPTRARWIS